MALAALLAALAAATLLFFGEPRWWFPAPISEHARAYDAQFRLTLWITGAIFLLAQGLLAWVVLRARDRGQTPSTTEGNNRLELIWTAATAALFLGMLFWGQQIWAGVHLGTNAPGALEVEVLAKQFAWSYRYPGPDGKFGRTSVRAIDDSAGNPFGIVDADSAGADDITAAALRVPAGREILLHLKSRDVIHNFFVRELRLKQDVMPGMVIPLRFTASTPGVYEVPCSELCGLGHHQMRSTLIVMPPEEFDSWLREQASR
jgi:cytochrome c oxidase subunit II